MTPRDDLRWRLLSLKAAFTRKRIRHLCKSPRPIAFTTAWGGTAVIHLDTYPTRAGTWRATWLDSEGLPSGHADCSDFTSALKRALEEGADLFNEVPSPLETVP